MSTHYIHRGLAKKNFKENTLSEFKYSFKKKYGIETDLQVTKDNQLICFHDFNLRRKFNLNKKVKDIDYSRLKKISNKRKAMVPLLKDLLKISKNKYPLLLEIKPLLTKQSLLSLIKLTKKTKKYGIFSFREKNLINLYKLNKKLPLGLLFLSTSNLRTIKSKHKKPYVKFLGLEKSFLSNKKLTKIRKPIYYYTVKRKSLFKKYKNNKNLIFENL
jgi:glycerophosphoryl diester phosphodiesterase|tara:strand:+ start:909 stop:1556 length:648 start_codon:yes stop_codon:yes gene_type:complete